MLPKIASRSTRTGDLGADSLTLMDLTLAIEEAFDIETPDEDADKTQTVRDDVDAFEKRL
jgi:acyl carrier protein